MVLEQVPVYYRQYELVVGLLSICSHVVNYHVSVKGTGRSDSPLMKLPVVSTLKGTLWLVIFLPGKLQS